jgi:hypothetical protein
VLYNGAYYRETTLPLCEWGTGSRSFHQFLGWIGQDEPIGWTCAAGGGTEDSCTFSGAPDFRPTNPSYGLGTRTDYYWFGDLVWSDGHAAYGGWGISCVYNSSSTAVKDTVTKSSFEGMSWNGSACQGLTTLTRATVVAELAGGDVEHIRPAIVRAQANMGYYSYAGPRYPNDLVLAIQVYGSSGWEDFKTVTRTTGAQPALYEVEATVPEGSSIRLQVRGTQGCQNHYGDGYDLRDLRIQVETCIPDQNNPGNCL